MSFKLVYVSRSTDDLTDEELHKLYNTCKEFNLAHSITGMLMYEKGKFIQVLEGYRNKINELVERIKEDRRNEELEIIYQAEVPEREFESWSMGLKASDVKPEYEGVVNLDERESIVPQLKTNPGIAKMLLLTFYLAMN